MTRCFILALLLSSTAGAEELTRGFRLELLGPATPYARVLHEISPRRGVVVASISKIFTADFGRREEVSVLDEAALNGLSATLGGLDACQLPDETRPNPRSVYRLTCGEGGGFTVHDPHLSLEPRYAKVIAALRGFIARRAPRVEFRDPLLRPGEFGWLRVDAAPTARVYVDGVALEGQTPISDRAAVGTRVIELEPIEGGARHRYEVQVEPKRTTSLVVELS